MANVISLLRNDYHKSFIITYEGSLSTFFSKVHPIKLVARCMNHSQEEALSFKMVCDPWSIAYGNITQHFLKKQFI